MSSFQKAIIILISSLFTFCKQDFSEEKECKVNLPVKKIINYPNSLFYDVNNEDLKNAKNIIYFKNILFTIEDSNKIPSEFLYTERLYNKTLYGYDHKIPIDYEVFGRLEGKGIEENYYFITFYKKANKIFKKYKIIADSCFIFSDTINILKLNKLERYSIFRKLPYETDSENLNCAKEYINLLCKNNGLKVIKIDTFRNISYDLYGKDKWGLTNNVIENSIIRSYNDGNKEINFAGFSTYTLLDKEFLNGVHNYHYYDASKQKWIKIMPFQCHRFTLIWENIVLYDYGCCGASPVVNLLNYISNDTILKSNLKYFIKFYDSYSKNNIIGYFGLDYHVNNKQMFICNNNRTLKMVDLIKYDYDEINLNINDTFEIDILKDRNSFEDETINIPYNSKLKFSLIKKGKVVFNTEIRFY
jgi:hypothetical protein